MSRKILLIYRVDKSDKSNIGVVNKLIGQIDGFTHNKVKIDYVIHDDRYIYLNSKVVFKLKSSGPNVYFKWRFFDYLPHELLEGYTQIIIRHGVATLSFLRFLKTIKKINPKAKILIDMPTYPYSKEWKGISGKLVMLVDGALSSQLKKHVDYILHSGKEIEIFGIPTFPFSNGISLENVKIRSPKKSIGRWTFLAIGKWQYWHGLDRLIQGLHQYVSTGKKDVRLKIVGTGPVEKDLKQLVKNFDLEKYVDFEGVLVGADLDASFDDADIGIGTLGLFRKGVRIDSSLKHREYVGRGLPFVLAGEETDFTDDLSFIHQVGAKEGPINIEAIVSFLKQADAKTMSIAAGAYAEKHLTWRMKMKILIQSVLFKE